MQIADTGVFPDFSRAPPGSIVLQATIDVIGQVIIHGDMVELGEWQVAHKTECLTLITRDGDTAVIAEDQVF